MEIKREFGRLKATLFWLHSFEEPFYTRQNFEAIAQSSLFGKGRTQLFGLFCCLILKK